MVQATSIVATDTSAGRIFRSKIQEKWHLRDPCYTSRVAYLARRLARPVGFIGLVSLLSGASCTLLNSLDGYSGGQGDASTVRDAETDSSLAPDADAGPSCDHARPPQKSDPALDAPGNFTVRFATSSYVLSLSTGAPDSGLEPGHSGFDLDNLCTCAPDEPACVNKFAKAAACDLAQGIDNASATLFNSLNPFINSSPDFAAAFDSNRYIRNGVYTILFEIANWNGTDNDSTVLFRVIGSGPLENSTIGRDGGAPPTPPGATPSASAWVPASDGKDVWAYDDRGVQTDSNAYVRNGVIVSFANTQFKLGRVSYPIEYGTITAKIGKTNGLYTLSEGLVGGRVSATALLTGLQQLDDPTSGTATPLCRDRSPVFDTLHKLICRNIDLASTPANDGKDLPCESLSAGIGFSAVESKFGSKYSPPVDNHPCGVDYVDSCNY